MSYIGRTPTNAALTASDLADGIVGTAKIAADAVTDAKIADDVVGTEHLTANEVDTAALKGDAVTGAELADNAVNSEHYTDGSIDTVHLADGQVTIGKLATAVLTGATDIGAAIVDADLFLVDDGAGGTLRKTTAARLKTYAAGLGKVGQVINSTTSYAQSTTGTTVADVLSASGTSWETAITPTATSSKILVTASVCIFNSQNGNDETQENRFLLHFDQKIGSNNYATAIDQNYIGDYYYDGTQKTDLSPKWTTFSILRTTNTTSEVKFKFQYALHSSGGKVELNNDGKISSITLMEILA